MVHGAQRTVFPKDTIISFTKIKNQLKAPFIVYTDFECLLVPINDYDPAYTIPVQKMNVFFYLNVLFITTSYTIITKRKRKNRTKSSTSHNLQHDTASSLSTRIFPLRGNFPRTPSPTLGK